jgi:NitT/TauT family transport system substrate-binding protein
MHRRDFLSALGGGLAGVSIAKPALAQAKTKVRVGFLHTLAVDGQIWTGIDHGSFDKQALDLELRQFNTGLEIFQALIGGSLDVLATGAVLSNFPARGQGRVFLINDIEVATAQLWVRGDQGIKSFEDLKGKRIATAIGTTAHVFLDRALRANKIDPKEVDIVNQTMPAAVTAFISGAVPAVALWVPFNITVRDKVPGAVKLADASAYYPQAAIIGGWAARNDYFMGNRDILVRMRKVGPKPTTTCCNIATRFSGNYNRSTIALLRSPTSRSNFRLRRCFLLRSGRSTTSMAQSQNGCSSPPISSCPMQV